MAFDEKTIAEIVRHRLKLTAAAVPEIVFQIPAALEQLARKVAANPRKRPLLTTQRDATEIPLTLGAVDLETYNQTAPKKLLVEYLHVGKIYYESATPRQITAVQSIAAFDLLFKAAHLLFPGQPIIFPSGPAAGLPGIAFAYDTTYYVIIPTQAQLDATGFLNAVPADYVKLANSYANAIAGTAMDMNASNLGLIVQTVDGTLDTDPLQKVDTSQARRTADHPFYGDYRFYYMDGPVLRVIDPATQNYLLGSLHFEVPYQPTLTQLANIPELHADFLEKMVELCAGPGNDAADDGEH